MHYLIAALSLLLAAPPAFRCLEGYTSVPLIVAGKVAPGETFRQEISQGFYFAAGNVRVQAARNPHIYLWLTPEATGWRLHVGPQQAMMPDYVAVTALPILPPITFGTFKPAKGTRFCFTMEPRDYEAAVRDVKATGESGIIDILSAQCEKNDEGIGRGVLNAAALPGGSMRFEASLKIPIYTTDCPAR